MSEAFPKILLSLSALYEWETSIRGMNQISSIILDNASKIDGFEINCRFSDLERWILQLNINKHALPGRLAHLDSSAAEVISNAAYNTVHLDDLKQLVPGREEWLAERINRLYEKTGISEFTIHPDESSPEQWEKLMRAVPENIRISVENMCHRKRDYQSLKELGDLLRRYSNLFLTFDICHWAELGGSLIEPGLKDFFVEFGERISKIHFSTFESKASFYKGSEEINHKLLFNSGYEIPIEFYSIPKTSSAWVIEGYFPPFRADLLNYEVAGLRDGLAGVFEQFRQTA